MIDKIMRRLLNPKEEPWNELEKDFKFDVKCEECGEPPKSPYTVDGLIVCEPCKDAIVRRHRFEQEEDEWNKP